MITYTTNAPQAVPAAVMSAAGDDADAWLPATGVRVNVAREAVLFQQGDTARSCYRIVSGAVRLCKIMADGRRYVVDFLLPGDLIGLEAGDIHAFTAEAIVDTELTRYARPQLRLALEGDARAGRRLLDLTMQSLAAAQDQLLLLGRMNALERVATFLLQFKRRLGAHLMAQPIVPLAMTRADIADHLGLTLETVSRMLAELKRRGIIELPHPQEIHIRDRAALAALVGNARH